MPAHPRLPLAIALALSLVGGAHAAKYKVTWLLGHENLDYFEDAAIEFKQAVEQGSGGEIAVDIRAFEPDGGAAVPVSKRVADGEAEMGHSFADVLGGLDPRFHVFDAPYLFRGYRHLEGVFEGDAGAGMLDGLRRHGLVGLSFTYSGGANCVATIDHEVRQPGDLEGLRVGAVAHPVNEAWLSALGAKLVPIGHDLEKVLPMARQRSLDAVITTWRNFDREGLKDEFTHANLVGSTYLVSVTYANPKFFDSLPPGHRDLLVKASRAAGRAERLATIRLNESARRGLVEDHGVRAVSLSAAGRRAFDAALQRAYERAIRERLGTGLLEAIRATPDAPEDSNVPALAQR